MAFSVSTINDYVQANENSLIGKAVIGGKTASLLNLQTGVKDSAYLNLLTADPTLQAGACGWNPAGTTTVTRRKIQTGQIKVNTPFCDKDLFKTYMAYGTKVAIGQKTMPFEEEFIMQNIKEVNRKLEETIWQGDATGSAGTHLDRFDGFKTIIDNASGVVNATHGTPKVILTYPKECIDAVVAAIPNGIIDRSDLVVFVGYDVFRAYVAALQAANLYHYTADLAGNMSMTIPGTSIRLEGVHGLTGVKRIYASALENMYFGTDMENDQEKFKFWYSEDNSEFRLKIEFNGGVQVAFPDLVTKYLGA